MEGSGDREGAGADSTMDSTGCGSTVHLHATEHANRSRMSNQCRIRHRTQNRRSCMQNASNRSHSSWTGLIGGPFSNLEPFADLVPLPLSHRQNNAKDTCSPFRAAWLSEREERTARRLVRSRDSIRQFENAEDPTFPFLVFDQRNLIATTTRVPSLSSSPSEPEESLEAAAEAAAVSAAAVRLRPQEEAASEPSAKRLHFAVLRSTRSP